MDLLQNGFYDYVLSLSEKKNSQTNANKPLMLEKPVTCHLLGED